MSHRRPTTAQPTAGTLAPTNQEVSMSNTADSLTALSRRTWIGLVVVEVVLFALANLTAKNSSHPGTVSNVLFAASGIGAALLITLAVVTVVRSRRGATR
jgi:hypothetical protein